MLARIALLFLTSSFCAADNVNQYSSNQQGYVYEPQRCLGGFCSQRPQFPASFSVPDYPKYFQGQDSTYRNIQQGNGGGFFSNQQGYVYQKPLFPASLGVPEYRPQFTQTQPFFHGNTQQGNGVGDYSNRERYINQHQQYVNQPQPYVNQLQQYVNQPQPYVNQLQQYVNQPQTYVNHPQQYVNQPQPYVNQPQQYVNHPQQYVNGPQQYVNHPLQYVNQPQPEDSSGYFYNKPTSPTPTSTPTPLLPPTQAPPQYLLAASYSTSGSNRVSERNCYSTYVPVPGVFAIMGGDLTKIGEFPYMAAIGYRRQGGGYDYQCGGTTISSVYVLTAAHCRTSGGQVAAVVKPGGAKLDDNSVEYEPIEIMDIIVHPNYKRKQVYDDIALLRLKQAPNGKPACLWTKDEINYNTATAIGYGQTATRLSTSNDLFKVDLQLYSSQVCQAYYTPRFRIERGLIDSQICAGDFNKAKDTCPGDSGGPLLARTTINNTQIPFILGVTSFGPGCAEGIPGVYTKVSSYLDWIEPIVWPEG